jgi:hypothetical protein
VKGRDDDKMEKWGWENNTGERREGNKDIRGMEEINYRSEPILCRERNILISI